MGLDANEHAKIFKLGLTLRDVLAAHIDPIYENGVIVNYKICEESVHFKINLTICKLFFILHNLTY